MKGNSNNDKKRCHGGKWPHRSRAGKEKTGLVSQRMAEEAGEFRMSTT
jgi:hypothetical protein